MDMQLFERSQYKSTSNFEIKEAANLNVLSQFFLKFK